MKWIAKAFVQKGISFLPKAEQINLLFQKYITKGVTLDNLHFRYKVEAGGDHLMFFDKVIQNKKDLKVLELGTGWYPIVPLVFYLADAGKVTSIDIRDWTTKENHLTAIRKLLEWHASGRLKDYVHNIRIERINKLKEVASQSDKFTLESINELIGLQLVTGDARCTQFEDNSFDMICSNNTFEHIYPDILREILEEFKRICKPNGMMSHFIDLSDHFAHFDSSITIYNFLKFSPRQWEIIDNDIQPQNRLRWSQYIEMYRDLGIPVTKTSVRKGNIQEVETVTVHKEYARFPPHELAISHGYIVSDFADQVDIKSPIE